MAQIEFPGQFTPSLEELNARWKRAFSGAMTRRGATPNVLPGSEADAHANATSQQAVVAFANNKISQRNWSPLTSTGEQLLELCSAYGIEPRTAGKAAGPITIRVAGSGTVTIPADFVIDADDGTSYKTTSNNFGVANGASIQIIAVNGGKGSDQAEGKILRWRSASVATLKQEAEVGVGGLTGGRDADGEEVMRSRLLARIANPGQGYNWAQIKEWAEEAAAGIEAWVYPALFGPSSIGVAVALSTGNREVEDPIVQLIASYIASKLPGRERLNVVSVAATSADLCIKAELAASVAAGGTGGGWIDDRPWPNNATGAIRVDSYDSTTKVITTDVTGASTGIVVGTRVAVWDATIGSERFHHYTVSEVTGFAPISFKVQGNPVMDHTGAFISADAANLDAYGATVLKAMRELGPGERSDSPFVLPRALRKPAVSAGFPAAINSKLLATITNTHKEISALSVQSAPQPSPPVPSTTADPPNILVLGSLAFIASTA